MRSKLCYSWHGFTAIKGFFSTKLATYNFSQESYRQYFQENLHFDRTVFVQNDVVPLLTRPLFRRETDIGMVTQRSNVCACASNAAKSGSQVASQELNTSAQSSKSVCFYFMETNSSQIEKLCNIIFEAFVYLHFRVHKLVNYKLMNTLNILFSILCIINFHNFLQIIHANYRVLYS